MSSRVSPPPTTLHGRWLFLARMAWVMLAITAMAIVVCSVPSSFEHYSSVCTAASEVCSERAVDQPTPQGVRALRDVGLSVSSYALLNVIVDKVFQLVWFVVGALIFWRRSDDRMALLVSAFLVSRAGYGRYHGCRSLDLLPAGLVVARPGRADRGGDLLRAVLLAVPRRTFRAALDALARHRVHRFSDLQRSTSGFVRSFVRAG